MSEVSWQHFRSTSKIALPDWQFKHKDMHPNEFSVPLIASHWQQGVSVGGNDNCSAGRKRGAGSIPLSHLLCNIPWIVYFTSRLVGINFEIITDGKKWFKKIYFSYYFYYKVAILCLLSLLKIKLSWTCVFFIIYYYNYNLLFYIFFIFFVIIFFSSLYLIVFVLYKYF